MMLKSINKICYGDNKKLTFDREWLLQLWIWTALTPKMSLISTMLQANHRSLQHPIEWLHWATRSVLEERIAVCVLAKKVEIEVQYGVVA